MMAPAQSRYSTRPTWIAAFLLMPVMSAALAQVPPDTLRKPKITIHVVTPPPPPTDTPLVRHVAPSAPLVAELTRKSRLATRDTLFVFSRSFPDVYEGQPIDTTFYDLLAPFYSELAFPHAEPLVFATYRVTLDKERTGFLLRVPGMYEPSAIDLWVYDRRRMQFEPPLRLAESWGDAGAEYDLNAWLVDLDRDGRLDAVLRQRTSYTKIESDSLVSQSDSLWVVSWVRKVRTRQLRVVASPLGVTFDPQRWRRPWGGAENGDGARFVWSFLNRIRKQGDLPYPYVAAKDIPLSHDFSEVPPDSLRHGDVVWWPTFVGIFMEQARLVLTGDDALPLDTLVTQKGPARFFRRLVRK